MRHVKKLKKLDALIPALEQVGDDLYDLRRYGHNQVVNLALDYLRHEKAILEAIAAEPYHGACLTCVHYLKRENNGEISLVCPNCRYYGPDWSLPSFHREIKL